MTDPAVPVLMNVTVHDLRYMYSKIEVSIRENGNARIFFCQNLCFAQIHIFATEDQNVFSGTCSSTPFMNIVEICRYISSLVIFLIQLSDLTLSKLVSRSKTQPKKKMDLACDVLNYSHLNYIH